MPTSVDDATEYWNGMPTNARPGHPLARPRCSIGSPSSPTTPAMSIQRRSGRDPVHQTTVAASMTAPSAVTGCPASTPAMRPTRATPARSRSAGLLRTSMTPCASSFARIARPCAESIVMLRM